MSMIEPVALKDEQSDAEMGSSHIASLTGQPALSLDATVDIGLALSITAHPVTRVNMLVTPLAISTAMAVTAADRPYWYRAGNLMRGEPI